MLETWVLTSWGEIYCERHLDTHRSFPAWTTRTETDDHRLEDRLALDRINIKTTIPTTAAKIPITTYSAEEEFLGGNPGPLVCSRAIKTEIDTASLPACQRET